MSAPLDPFAAIEAAALPAENRGFDRPGEHEIELSKAISLKRIADVLDGTAAGVCVTSTIFGGVVNVDTGRAS